MTDEEIEVEAKKWGHRPLEAHRGDPSKWQDPKEFLERSLRETPSHIKQLKKQDQIIKTQNKIIENLKRGVENEKASLEPKMKEAFENADFNEFRKLQTKESELNDQARLYEEQLVSSKDEVEPNNAQAYAEEAMKWIQKHPEYNTDNNIKKVADKLFDSYRNDYPNATPHQILQAVDIGVQNYKSSQTYNGVQSRTSNMLKDPRQKTANYLTDSAKKIMNDFINHGGDKELYIKNCDDSCFVWGNK